MRYPIALTLILITVFTSTSCLHAQSVDEEEIASLSAALIKVSSTVHTAVRYKSPDPSLQDKALLEFAISHNPRLLNRFDAYVLKARQTGANSSVLVCTADGVHALIEDAGCTGRSDWHVGSRAEPCEFKLDLSAVCASP